MVIVSFPDSAEGPKLRSSPAGGYHSVCHSFLAQRLEGSYVLFEIALGHGIGKKCGVDTFPSKLWLWSEAYK
jgi:hypothetical protein